MNPSNVMLLEAPRLPPDMDEVATTTATTTTVLKEVDISSVPSIETTEDRAGIVAATVNKDDAPRMPGTSSVSNNDCCGNGLLLPSSLSPPPPSLDSIQISPSLLPRGTTMADVSDTTQHSASPTTESSPQRGLVVSPRAGYDDTRRRREEADDKIDAAVTKDLMQLSDWRQRQLEMIATLRAVDGSSKMRGEIEKVRGEGVEADAQQLRTISAEADARWGRLHVMMQRRFQPSVSESILSSSTASGSRTTTDEETTSSETSSSSREGSSHSSAEELGSES